MSGLNRGRHRWLALAVSLLLASACRKPVGPALAADPPPRVDNPFVDATYYRNPAYAEKVLAARSEAPSRLRKTLGVVAESPVAVWLERIDAVSGAEGMSLEDHLDAALAQQPAADRQVLVPLVLYDLPNRDCAANASAGELHLEQGGMERYQHEYIDAIAEIVARPEYERLRIVAFVEPDSLPNLVTNRETPACAAAADAYVEGVAYAIQALSRSANVYIYLDMAHAGWLGWDHARPAAILYRMVLDRAGGEHLVSGFVTNVSNYVPLDEDFDPYLDPDQNRETIEQFYEWNRVLDAHTYVDTLRRFFPEHGFVIDTGRNGWIPRSGARSDRRAHRNEWCNVATAGLGERAMPEPREGVHAYYWIKPPGESDGTGNPADERADPSCPADAPPAGELYPAALFGLAERAEPQL